MNRSVLSFDRAKLVLLTNETVLVACGPCMGDLRILIKSQPQLLAFALSAPLCSGF